MFSFFYVKIYKIPKELVFHKLSQLVPGALGISWNIIVIYYLDDIILIGAEN